MNMLLATIFFAFVQSPLATTNDYYFTTPLHPWFVQGKLLGTSPQVPCPLRGEDQVYMFEAFTEIDQLANSATTYSFSKTQGIDPPAPSKFVRGISGRGVRPFTDIYTIIDSKALFRSGVTITGNPTNLVLSRSSGKQIYDYSRKSIESSGAYTVNRPENVNLGAMPSNVTNIRAMVATNVSCYYRTLKTVAGYGKDYNVQNSNIYHEYQGHVTYTEASFNYYDKDFTYYNYDYNPSYGMYGGGLYSGAISQNSIRQVYTDNQAYQSSPLPHEEEYDYYANDPVTAQLFTNAYARASNLTFVKGWMIYTGTCSDYKSIWHNPTTQVDEIAYYTNATMVVECQATFSETNGIVQATITTDYEGAWNVMFGSGGISSEHMPSIYIVPPPSNAFRSDESTTKSNYRSMYVTIRPAAVALLIGVNWHSGFQGI